MMPMGLPLHVPWNLIAVSPDMMDSEPLNRSFPAEWRSSLAISIYEPKTDDLPPELCDQIVTYVKLTCTVTGFQPSKGETSDLYRWLGELTEGAPRGFDEIIRSYWACYGALINLAVFPNPHTRKAPDQPRTIHFGQVHASPALANPFEMLGASFQALDGDNQPANATIDIPRIVQPTTNVHCLTVRSQLTIRVPATLKVEGKLAWSEDTSIAVVAYSGDSKVGSRVFNRLTHRVEASRSMSTLRRRLIESS